MAASSDDDFRQFIARMPPVVGEEATEKLLLPKISELCSHPQPRVREACVHFLIDLACFVNSMITENIIVSKIRLRI